MKLHTIEYLAETECQVETECQAETAASGSWPLAQNSPTAPASLPSRQQSRRAFLQSVFSACFLLSSASVRGQAAQQNQVFRGKQVFERIMRQSDSGGWKQLAIGDLMGKIAKELECTPYKSGTLELSALEEIVSVNLEELDCVTFFESTLALARMIKKGGRNPEDLLAEVAFTRYRGGKPGDFVSRLHYTSDWLYDNEEKGVVKLLSELPGAQVFRQPVGFMTEHPVYYRQLTAKPQLIASLKHQEELINKRSLKFLPMDQIEKAEPFLKTGDIVGVCTKQPGLDITHTGLVYRSQSGLAQFMHASSSSKKMQVLIEPGPISQALNWSKELSGAMFARPLET